ncbi:MAG: hypothetical protein SV422_03255 [Pseudomonadota bacterium]|nr:hypothetical protein [Pseudomonadota bacterium]
MKPLHPRHREQGLSLATALFVITVMGLLAVMIFQLVRSNAETAGEELQLIRAFYAAESGVQFGLNAVFPPGAGTRSCPATFTLEDEGLAGCEAEVSCTSVMAESSEYHTITSKGTCGDVSRTIQVRAK